MSASQERGFFSQSFAVTLATATPDSVIRYTFDNSTPLLTSPTAATYACPITINKTTTLRYAAFKSGSEPSGVVT